MSATPRRPGPDPARTPAHPRPERHEAFGEQGWRPERHEWPADADFHPSHFDNGYDDDGVMDVPEPGVRVGWVDLDAPQSRGSRDDGSGAGS